MRKETRLRDTAQLFYITHISQDAILKDHR